MKLIPFIFILVLSFVESTGLAVLRCENIFKSDSFSDSSLRAEEIVLTSSPMKELISQLKTMTGTPSSESALVELKRQRPADFRALQKRIHLAADTIETLAEAEAFSQFLPKTKSFIYKDLTEGLLQTKPAEGWRSLLKWKRVLYFANDDMLGDVSSVIQATREVRHDWHVDIETKATLDKYIRSVINKRLELEKNFGHIYSDFILLEMTYKENIAGVAKVIQYCENLLSSLENYDSKISTAVNDEPVDEAVAIRDQLEHHIQKLNILFQKLSPEQRATLKTNDLIGNLQSYQSRMAGEILQYQQDLREMQSLARIWEDLDRSE
jgi:hypothetical protein